MGDLVTELLKVFSMKGSLLFGRAGPMQTNMWYAAVDRRAHQLHRLHLLHLLPMRSGDAVDGRLIAYAPGDGK